jgi:hypothetical protein
MTRTTRHPKRVFWACAAFALPLLNPVVVVVLGRGGVGIGIALAVIIDLALLSLAARAAWPDAGERRSMLLAGMLIAVGCSVFAAMAEFLILYGIAAANCPPDAYECPF